MLCPLRLIATIVLTKTAGLVLNGYANHASSAGLMNPSHATLVRERQLRPARYGKTMRNGKAKRKSKDLENRIGNPGHVERL